MRIYLVSLGAGLLVGVVYALLGVRSPAPPVVALVGLFGILVGEQIPPLARAVVRSSADTAAVLSRQVRPHVFGHLPRGDHIPAARGEAERPS
jgi:XapX domain-containing protein